MRFPYVVFVLTRLHGWVEVEREGLERANRVLARCEAIGLDAYVVGW